MSKVNSLLSKRLQKGERSEKMAALAKKSAAGDLHSLSGVFAASQLSEGEEETLRLILERYGEERLECIDQDLCALKAVTSEVKAINHQAALLHGERIRRAQEILKTYQDGAFTSWLMATYGNRQTPYNFLQYYLFYQELPLDLRPQVELMPRQAIYTLASRNGAIDDKHNIIRSFSGQTKQELLDLIRDLFPLDEGDRRRPNTATLVLSSLEKAAHALSKRHSRIGPRQKEVIREHLELIESLLLS
ncbi:MAG: CT583 family protein [Chlamydiia bacterium]|nr:CT583 family protein [Chlamydiia bacterium]